MLIYQLDSNNQYNGITKEVTPKDPIPRNWVITPPPEGDGYKFWDGTRWIILSEYRVLPKSVPPRMIPLIDFRKRLTLEEKVAIENAKATDTTVKVFTDDLMATPDINLEDKDLLQGLDYLVSKSLLTEERKQDILM